MYRPRLKPSISQLQVTSVRATVICSVTLSLFQISYLTTLSTATKTQRRCYDLVWINGRMISTRENQSTSRKKTCLKNPTRTRMELSPGLQNEKPSSPVSKNSSTFLLPGVGYRATTSVVSTGLHPPQGKYGSYRRSDAYV
jgi:hypothetical protein